MEFYVLSSFGIIFISIFHRIVSYVHLLEWRFYILIDHVRWIGINLFWHAFHMFTYIWALFSSLCNTCHLSNFISTCAHIVIFFLLMKWHELDLDWWLILSMQILNRSMYGCIISYICRYHTRTLKSILCAL